MGGESAKDKIMGKAKQMKGKASGDNRARGEGQADEAKGKAKGAMDNAKQKAQGMRDSFRDRDQ
ncbi:CsbD family protein [Streptomyces sp. NPDC003077]|uniref:CsbD family protein n=1 Tax=Streptomyces sp. NPDC003077 TaxID=3154443 RepID=UPI0033AEB2D1